MTATPDPTTPDPTTPDPTAPDPTKRGETAAPVVGSAPDPAPWREDVRVGVIGVGRMGADHVVRLSERTKGARVSVVTDYAEQTAQQVSALAPGSRVVRTWQELIAAEDVDAVLVASPGAFHREQVIACIEAGKPVLCEKPLALTPEDAYEVVRAEHASGRRSVSLGFMRRFDAEYAELKDALDAGELGSPLIINCKHRNASTLPDFEDRMMVHDSAVHEIDAISYFLDEPVMAVQTIVPTPSENAPAGRHDPLLFVFRTASGRIVTDELSVNTRSGYEVRTEIVGSRGTATIGLDVGRVSTQLPGGTWGGRVPADFRPRFAAAYDAEIQAWIHAVRDGSLVAPRSADAWDGYRAAAVCEAAERSLTAEGFVGVDIRSRP